METERDKTIPWDDSQNESVTIGNLDKKQQQDQQQNHPTYDQWHQQQEQKKQQIWKQQIQQWDENNYSAMETADGTDEITTHTTTLHPQKIP